MRTLCETIRHRGPDAYGETHHGKFAIGNCRLSIIDIPQGTQPCSNETKTIWVVFNGEIYNFREIRKTLIQLNHRFCSNSDTEVLVHLYEEFGEAMFQYLDGMFAFCILDTQKNTFFLARDRIGKKPLFYYSDQSLFVFASEIKALLAIPAISRTIAPDALAAYFTYGFIPEPKTIFQNIYSVEAGSFFYADEKNTSTTQPFCLTIDTPFQLPTQTTALLDSVEEKIISAVKKRLVSDVPIGLFLSGGIDSSLIAATLTRHLRKNIDSFSIGFTENSSNESEYARKVAEHFKLPHTVQLFSYQDCLNLMPHLGEIAENPLCDYSILPLLLLSRFAKTTVKVALSGDGGDELFAGYPKYSALKISRFFDYFSQGLKTRLAGYFHGQLRKGSRRIIRNFFEGLEYPWNFRGFFWDSAYKPYEIPALILGLSKKPEYQLPKQYHESNDLLNTAMSIDFNRRMRDSFLVKIDRTSMHNSLEIRCPFLDIDLSAFADSIPSRKKISFFDTKIILKQILSRYLPKSLVYRKKHGFGIPLAEWLRGGLKEFVRKNLADSALAQGGILNQKTISRYLDSHISGKEDLHNNIWSLLTLELWYRRWMK